MHMNVCNPDLVKDVPTSFITKTSISYQKKERKKKERDKKLARANTRLDSQNEMVSSQLYYSFDKLP